MIKEEALLTILKDPEQSSYVLEEPPCLTAFPYKRIVIRIYSDLEFTDEEMEKTIKRTWGV